MKRKNTTFVTIKNVPMETHLKITTAFLNCQISYTSILKFTFFILDVQQLVITLLLIKRVLVCMTVHITYSIISR